MLQRFFVCRDTDAFQLLRYYYHQDSSGTMVGIRNKTEKPRWVTQSWNGFRYEVLEIGISKVLIKQLSLKILKGNYIA